MAKFRAARRLWARDHARPVRRHEPEGAGAALPRADRRLDAHRAAAGEQHRPRRRPGALGGLPAARSRSTRTPSTRRSRCPTERSARIALRTQQILAHEAGGTDTADPLGGSYFIEALTDELEERARELIERIDELGGAVAAVEQGFVQGEIEDAAFRYKQQVESGERVIVGVNRYEEDEQEPIELHRIDPEAERRQLERTARVRAERDAEAAEAALAEVRRVARGTENLLPPMREALRARCTVGEICDVLRDEFGMYDAQRSP